MRPLSDLITDLNSGDDARAEAAALRFPEHGQAGLEALLVLHQSNDSERRWWATRALAKFQEELAHRALAYSLKDPDPAVQYCAALALRRARPPSAIRPLVTALGSADAMLARLASDALTAIGQSAVEPLAKAANSPEASLRLEAIRALSLMKEPETIPFLYEALEDPSPWVQFWAEEGLDQLGVGMRFFQP
jgi:HEAT repeat protein